MLKFGIMATGSIDGLRYVFQDEVEVDFVFLRNKWSAGKIRTLSA